MRKHWKRLPLVAAMVVLWPLLIVALLWWDSRPKPEVKVSIGYLKTVSQGGSNRVVFVVTNQSDFPTGIELAFLSMDGFQGPVWPRVFPFEVPAMSNSLVSVGAFSTNMWRLHIHAWDARPQTKLEVTRDWISGQLFNLHFDWSWWLAFRIDDGKPAVYATGQVMLGDAPLPSPD